MIYNLLKTNVRIKTKDGWFWIDFGEEIKKRGILIEKYKLVNKKEDLSVEWPSNSFCNPVELKDPESNNDPSTLEYWEGIEEFEYHTENGKIYILKENPFKKNLGIREFYFKGEYD